MLAPAAAAAAAVARYLLRFRVEVTAVALEALVAVGVKKAQCRQAASLTSELAHAVAGSAAGTQPGRLHLDRLGLRRGDRAFD